MIGCESGAYVALIHSQAAPVTLLGNCCKFSQGVL